jgi:hypothetical protein
MDILSYDPVTFTAEVDGVVYVYRHDKNFAELKNKFFTALKN